VQILLKNTINLIFRFRQCSNCKKWAQQLPSLQRLTLLITIWIIRIMWWLMD